MLPCTPLSTEKPAGLWVCNSACVLLLRLHLLPTVNKVKGTLFIMPSETLCDWAPGCQFRLMIGLLAAMPWSQKPSCHFFDIFSLFLSWRCFYYPEYHCPIFSCGYCYRLKCIPSKFICRSPTLQNHRMWLYLNTGPLKGSLKLKELVRVGSL